MHGGGSEIHGGDGTPRDRLAKAVQEALYDVQLGIPTPVVIENVLAVYDRDHSDNTGTFNK